MRATSQQPRFISPIRVNGRRVTVVGERPELREVLKTADVTWRDGAMVAAVSGRVLDAHADPARFTIDRKPAHLDDGVVSGEVVRVQNGDDRVEPIDVRFLAALPKGLPPVENVVWRAGTPGLDRIELGHWSGEVVAREPIVPAGAATPDPDKVVALTFDDGPSPQWTPRVLDILRQFGAKATFCTVGQNEQRYPDLVRRTAVEGHTQCNHTMHHAYLDGLPVAQATQEIVDNAAILRTLTGKDVQFFRAPGGHLSPDVIRIAERHGERVLGWNVDPEDYRRPPPDVLRVRILGAVRPGCVVILHDGGGDRSNTVAALPAVLLVLAAQGYRVVAAMPSLTPPAF